MTREEAFNIIDTYCIPSAYPHTERWKQLQKIKEAVKTLKGLEQEPKWIPVSERLPEKNMVCLVAVGRYNLTQMAIYSDLMGTIDRSIFYQGDVGYDDFENITKYVKAWMPLPKPYKAESEE